MANIVNCQLSIRNVVAGLSRNRAAFLTTVVQQGLQVCRNLLGSAAGAILKEGAGVACAGNLLLSRIEAVSRLDVVDNGFEVDEVSAATTAGKRAAAVDAQGGRSSGERAEGENDRVLHFECSRRRCLVVLIKCVE